MWAELFNTPGELSIDDICTKAKLSSDEACVLHKYIHIVFPEISKNFLRWGLPSVEGENEFVKNISRLIVMLDSDAVKGDKENFLRIMFSPAMEYVKHNNGRISPKSEQFFDSLYELRLLSYFVQKGFEINLDVSSFDGKGNPEFLISNKNFSAWVEAKNIDNDKLENTIFGDWIKMHKNQGIPDQLNSIQKEENIREQFKKQFKAARTKFQNTNARHLICVQVNLPGGMYGSKLLKYLYKLKHNKYPGNYLGLLVEFERGKILVFPNDSFKENVKIMSIFRS